MTNRITTTRAYVPGVATFYVPASGDPHTQKPRVYNVKVIRQRGMRRFTCDCPDFVHRRQPLRQLCKHAHLVKMAVRACGGVRAFWQICHSHIVALAGAEGAPYPYLRRADAALGVLGPATALLGEDAAA